jgi:hypothetical protein
VFIKPCDESVIVILPNFKIAPARSAHPDTTRAKRCSVDTSIILISSGCQGLHAVTSVIADDL